MTKRLTSRPPDAADQLSVMSKIIKIIIIITLSAVVVITTAIAESGVPRQADISIAGIFLNNPESVQKVLGSLPATFESADQLPMVQICNSEINEILGSVTV